MTDQLLPHRLSVHLNWRILAVTALFIVQFPAGPFEAFSNAGGAYVVLTIAEWILQVLLRLIGRFERFLERDK